MMYHTVFAVVLLTSYSDW